MTLKTAKHKFALIGTSCAGKTTMAYGLVSRLKSYGVLADGVFNQDRKFSFDPSHLDTTEIAQNWMITNLISKEIELSLHGDVDLLISDRSPVDLFAYYLYQYPNSHLAQGLWFYVQQWAQTYDALYLLPPLEYQADGKRPPDDFRTNVHDVLVSKLVPYLPNVVQLERHKVLNDIMLRAGLTKPNVKTHLTVGDMLAVSTSLNLTLVVKKPKHNPDVLSDNDIYVLTDKPFEFDTEKLKRYLIGLLGQFTLLDVNTTASTSTFASSFDWVEPNGCVTELGEPT